MRVGLNLIDSPTSIDRDEAHKGATYITIGMTPVYDWAGFAPVGNEHTLTIHVWSRWSTKAKINEIVSELAETLGDAILSSSGRVLLNLEFQYAGAGHDHSGEILHGLIRYLVRSTPIN